MAVFRPLILNPTLGTAEVIDAADTLVVGGAGGSGGILHLGGALGLFGNPGVQVQPRIHGDFFQTLDQVIKALASTGFTTDERLADWDATRNVLTSLSSVGAYVTGRLVVGSTGGWTALDLPAERPGVVQVPARAGGVLAYVPVVSMTLQAPPRPEVGSVWGDISNGPDRIRLRMFDGNSWIDALPQRLLQLQNAMALAPLNALLVGDGNAWQSLRPGTLGQTLKVGVNGLGWADAVRVGYAPPWPNGSLRPNDDGAIWFDTTPGAEAVAFWNAQSGRWARAIADSVNLNQLAALHGQLRDGDLITYERGAFRVLHVGNAGDNLRTRGGVLAWEPTLRVSNTRGGPPPVPGNKGDLWLAGSALSVHDGAAWREVGLDVWTATFAGLRTIGPGTPVRLGSGGWFTADGTVAIPLSTSYAIATGAADPSKPLTAAYAGIVTLEENDWFNVLDAPTKALVVSGLPIERELWLSESEVGHLSTSPKSGILIGRSLSSSSLLLAGDGQSWARQSNLTPGTAGVWWEQVLVGGLASRLHPGDLLGWTGSTFDIATRIPGDRVAVELRRDSQLADPTSGAPVASGTTGAVAFPPTTNGQLSGVSRLADGELQLGTNPQDPALFWKLSDGSTTKLSRGDLTRSYGLIATDLASDPDAAMIELSDSAGGKASVVLRGADGLEVTRTNIGTLVISGAGLRAQLGTFDGGRFGAWVAGTAPAPGPIDAGDFTAGATQT